MQTCRPWKLLVEETPPGEKQRTITAARRAHQGGKNYLTELTHNVQQDHAADEAQAHDEDGGRATDSKQASKHSSSPLAHEHTHYVFGQILFCERKAATTSQHTHRQSKQINENSISTNSLWPVSSSAGKLSSWLLVLASPWDFLREPPARRALEAHEREKQIPEEQTN